MKVLITGANGMVAKAAIKYCSELGDEVLSYARKDLDITELEQVLDTVKAEKPDVILNCAAFTNVDAAETNIEECYKTNVNGVENLAKASSKIGATFVTISTDYVFDGGKEGFYTQEDTPNPQAVYAASKLEGEKRARAVNSNSIIARAGWIFGESGTNFLSVMGELLAEGKSIKVIRDSFGTPTYAPDLSQRLRELAILDKPNIFHIANSGEGVSFYEFALKVCEIGGYDEALVEAVSLVQMERPAARPKNSRLRCLFTNELGLLPLPDWENALERFMQKENRTV